MGTGEEKTSDRSVRLRSMERLTSVAAILAYAEARDLRALLGVRL